MIKLIALDFDFTLVDYQPGQKPHIEKEALEVLNNAAENGIQIGIVTGRAFDGLEDVLKNVGKPDNAPFPTYLIVNDSYLYIKDDDGSFIQDENENRAISDRIMMGVEKILPYIENCLTILRDNKLSPAAWSMGSKHGVTFEMNSWDDAQKGIELLDGYIPDSDCSRNCHLLHIMPSGENKGASVKRLAEKLGIRSDEVLAIGDSLNDLSMLDGRLGFHSGTPANGDDIVKRAVLANHGIVSEYRASAGTADCINKTLNICCH